MKIQWPRGRHNGRRITGLDLHAKLDLTLWIWCLPSIRYGRCLGLGPLRVWVGAAYGKP